MLIFGHSHPYDPIGFRHYQIMRLIQMLLMFGLTLWALIYLIRSKDKGPHEKIGLAVNLYWVLYYSFVSFGFLSLPKVS